MLTTINFRYVCPPGMEADQAPEGAAAAVGAMADVEMKSSEEGEKVS